MGIPGGGRRLLWRLRQTTRHELVVAAVSARYLAAGYQWERDRRPEYPLDHQADGVATKTGQVELIEVELTPKTRDRYRVILGSHSYRLEHGIDRIVYYCTAAAPRTINREADQYLFRDIRPRLNTVGAIDEKGRWKPAPELGDSEGGGTPRLLVLL